MDFALEIRNLRSVIFPRIIKKHLGIFMVYCSSKESVS